MSGLESAVLAVGKAVVTRAVAAWQGDRRARRERSSDLVNLVDLLAPAWPDLLPRPVGAPAHRTRPEGTSA